MQLFPTLFTWPGTYLENNITTGQTSNSKPRVYREHNVSYMYTPCIINAENLVITIEIMSVDEVEIQSLCIYIY